jgi:2-keto-4-pentenoate hydratase/2-oxohepta-3-ene-1,7-dioic acid hydratase in catechol pathway
MKFITFCIDTPVGPLDRVGVLRDGRAIDVAAAYAWQLSHLGVYAARELAEQMVPSDMTAFLSRWPIAYDVALKAVEFACGLPLDAINSFGARVSYASAEYRLRIPLRPRRIKDYLVYEDHKRKAMARRGLEMPELWYRMPTYTNRNAYGLGEPDQDIAWPSYTEKLDFEFEIAAVIGKAGRNIRAEEAGTYIAGFTIYNDFSARDIQADEGKIGAGVGKSKDFDQGNVLGPCIVSADEIDPANIEMVLRVDGEEWSRGSTAGMKFSWGQIIENASRDEMIYPGDVFASGTMDRGCSLELDRWIAPGAVIEMEARGIGLLRNRVIRNPCSSD